MNNTPNNNENNIDDILDILQKRKEQDIKSNKFSDDAPTRVDNMAVKSEAVTQKKQTFVFDDDIFKDNYSPISNPSDNDATITLDKTPSANTAAEKQNVASNIHPGSAQNTPIRDVKTDSTIEVSKVNISSVPATPVKSGAAPTASVSVANTNQTPAGNHQSPQKTASPLTQNPATKPQTPATPRPNPVQQAPKPAPKQTPYPTRTASGGTISLNDFDEATKPKKVQKKKDTKKTDNKFLVPGYVKVILYLLAVFSVSIFISFSLIYIGNDMFALTKQEKEITINIEEGSTLKEVAKQLHENGVIEYPGIYSIYVKIRTGDEGDVSEKFIPGEHILNSDMHYDQILSLLTVPQIDRSIVRVTIPEGYTIYEILDLLQEKKVIDADGREQLTAMLNDVSGLDYDFIPDADENTDKFYLLEGYIFPDTYDFYIGENITSVLSKFLSNFNNKFDATFYERCKDLGLTVDEVVTIASIIQAEGNNSADFYLISNVIHNRLRHPTVLGYNSPLLQSDATSVYAYQGSKKGSELSANELKEVDSPYNTYTNFGLTPGAICNPGHDAIHAALYPSEYITEVDESGNSAQIPIAYYYFYTASCNGKTYFSKNLDQHNAYVAADKNNDPNGLEQLSRKFK